LCQKVRSSSKIELSVTSATIVEFLIISRSMNSTLAAIVRYLSFVGVGFLMAPAIAQEVPTTLQQGMPYAEARQMLIEAGWQAIEISPMQRESQSDTVSYLVELGYNEVADCAGTGMGFCRLEFTTAEGQTLAIVTVNNQRGDEPTLYRWMLEEGQS
jgi:hypothetical protein